ncbi:hypothetical protein GCM10027049_29960 [Mucilaginibacter puniceus]
MNNHRLHLEWIPEAYRSDDTAVYKDPSKKKINLELTSEEKLLLKQKGITQKALMDYAIDEIIHALNASSQRAKMLQALFEFQQIPSIGIRFAHDLVFLGYYSLAELKDIPAPELLDRYEKKLGSRVDPCVEDQFRLVVHYANHPNSNKHWWDFTEERKAYRAQYGYPVDRP